MKMRNWLQLGRKLTDQYDMDASFQWVQQQLGYLTLAYWGFGVQKTTLYPTPFPVSINAGDLNGAIGYGLAFDPNGMLLQVLPTSTTARTFLVPAADPALDRWDLLCLRYVQGQDTLIQKPSAPLETTYLNLNDDFQVVVREGTPSANPTYPAKSDGDVILAGLRVPAGALAGPQVGIDTAVRELASAAAASLPQVVQEVLAGAIDDTNRVFSLSQPPIVPQSVIVFVDALALGPSDYLITGQTITLNDPPSPGQRVSAYYVANAAGSSNPLAGFQETPTGTVDGTNQTFTLSGLPADQRSTIVFVDGLKVPPTDWSLVQGSTNGSILFTTDATPQPGQILSVFYFVNPGTVGVAPAGTNQGGSTGGAGSASAPHVEYPVLSATDVANGYVSLLAVPQSPSTVVLDVIGAGAQAYGADFTVSGQKLSFQSTLTSGDTALQAGDRLRILYWT